ncbi:MAG TPA: hypothetical protein VJ919_00155, partial [Tangfeifania sp.]|nr:hypothetical protein [Tangfeifania sp.]
VDLTKRGGAFTVKDVADLNFILKKLFADKNYLDETSAVSKKYVAENVGATSLIIKKVFNK